jgi:hypothetical protein|tara:strand:+ start:1296 stop:1553 length:258 start_codon:yes stop_codon:yes gene_type:complete
MKWGKEITYSVSSEESWMVVSEGPWKWVYITTPIKDSDFQNLSAGVRPDFVNRKGMSILLAHFGVSKSVINKLFEKETRRVRVDV